MTLSSQVLLTYDFVFVCKRILANMCYILGGASDLESFLLAEVIFKVINYGAVYYGAKRQVTYDFRLVI